MRVFIQVILNFIVIIPSLIIEILIHRANPNNDSIIALGMETANAINSCIFYLYFAVSENSLNDQIY
jgi:hypothetical protein